MDSVISQTRAKSHFACQLPIYNEFSVTRIQFCLEWVMKRFLPNLFSGGYFLFVSLFCFAALNTYTYMFLVKTPPYLWLNWFVGHAAWLYWAAMAAGVAAHWDRTGHPAYLASWLAQAAVGILFSVRHTALTIHNDWTAFAWALALLLPALVVAGADAAIELIKRKRRTGSEFLSYLHSAAVAPLCAGISISAIMLKDHLHGIPIALHRTDVEAAVFSISEYLWLALLVVSLVNLLQYIPSKRVRDTWPTRSWAVFLLAFLVVLISLLRFLNSTLSAKGWPIDVYAFFLAVFIVFWGSSLWNLVSIAGDVPRVKETRAHGRRLDWLILAVILFVALIFPSCLGSGDWNGVIAGTFYLSFWALLGLVVYRLFPRRANFSFLAIVAILLVGGSAYWALHATAFLWAKELGGTEQDISMALQERRERNDAWQLVDKAFNYQAEILRRHLQNAPAIFQFARSSGSGAQSIG